MKESWVQLSKARMLLKKLTERLTFVRFAILLAFAVGLGTGLTAARLSANWHPDLSSTANSFLIYWGSDPQPIVAADSSAGTEIANNQDDQDDQEDQEDEDVEVADAVELSGAPKSVTDDSVEDLTGDVVSKDLNLLDPLSSLNLGTSDALTNTGITDDQEDDQNEIVASEDDIPDSLRAEFRIDANEVVILNMAGLSFMAPEVPELEEAIAFNRDSILGDHENRISEDFQIPTGLRKRVGFWFDIYSTYDSNHKIIHHALYPWIVYKVVDVSYIINGETPRHLWLRREKADRAVKKEALRICATLSRLAHRRNLKNLSDSEQEMVDLLKPLGGDVQKQARLALRSVRVQTGQKNFFADGIRISSGYMKTMENIFRAQKMPVELTRIPFVESSFNKRATSKVGALGIWQFMGNTGRKYMMVNGAIDERSSPFKATEAAARLLKENHLILHHSWPLAVTAWNHGPPGVRRAIARTGSKDLATIISHYRSRSFDFASANFYSEFLGALYAERYSDQIFGQIERMPEKELTLVKLSRAVRFNELLKVSGLTLTDLLALNPELSKAAKTNILLPRGFRLHVPESIIENLSKLFALNPPTRKGNS